MKQDTYKQTANTLKTDVCGDIGSNLSRNVIRMLRISSDQSFYELATYIGVVVVVVVVVVTLPINMYLFLIDLP
jgi:hypothetical protein